MSLDYTYTCAYSSDMSIEAILQNKAAPFEINGKQYMSQRFMVRDWDDLRGAFKVVQNALANKTDENDFIDAMMSDAKVQAWTLLACGTTISEEEIIALDKEAFMLSFSVMVGTNADFFADAVRRYKPAAAKQKTKTATAKTKRKPSFKLLLTQ